MAELTHKDVVVFIPGIMGSALSHRGKPVWEPRVGAALRAFRTLGRSIRDLTLDDWVGDDAPADSDKAGGVTAHAVLPDVHVIPGFWTANIGYGKVVKWLQTEFALTTDIGHGMGESFVAFPYDWRLSNRYNARLLKARVENVLERRRGAGGPYADAKLIFVCHSMGGLVARSYIDLYGGRELTRKLITWGTPHRGAMAAADTLSNGLKFGVGPLRLGIGLTAFTRSLPSMYQLLPEYACLETASGALATIPDVGLSNVDAYRVTFGVEFHAALDAAPIWAPDLDVYPLVGQLQRTPTTGRTRTDGRLDILTTRLGDELRGDGTVPRLAATPKLLKPSDPSIRYATDKHGSLQSNRNVLDDLSGILTAKDVILMGPEATTKIDVRTPDLVGANRPISVTVVTAEGDPRALQAVLVDEQGRQRGQAKPLAPRDGAHHCRFVGQPEGVYTVRVGGSGAAIAAVTPVTSLVTVWDAHTDIDDLV